MLLTIKKFCSFTLARMKQGLLCVLGYVPFVSSLVWFPWQTHSIAIRKFLVLWVLSSLPVIVAIFYSPMPVDSQASLTADILQRLSSSISVSEQFVYIASFLTPLLYIFYEKYNDSSDAEGRGERLAKSFQVFRGYWLVFLFACLLILFTGLAFGSMKSNPEIFKSTYLYNALANYSSYIYIFALYCWYLSYLDGAYKGDFVGATRAKEKKVSKGLSDRVLERGVDNDE